MPKSQLIHFLFMLGSSKVGRLFWHLALLALVLFPLARRGLRLEEWKCKSSHFVHCQ